MDGMSFRQRMQFRVTPALLTGARLLELQGMALHEAIQAELAANPALDQLDADGGCPFCGGPVIGECCQRCGHGAEASAEAGDRQEGPDLFAVVAQPWSLADTLLLDLRASLSADDAAIALALVGSLDARGLLTESPVQLAVELDVPPERVNAALGVLRELGPPGIGARSLPEQILAQLEALEPGVAPCAYMYEIVGRHLDDLAEGRFAAIERELGVARAEIECVWRLLRQTPGLGGVAPGSTGGGDRFIAWLTPDVVIGLEGDEISVEVLASPARWLRVNPVYRQLAEHSAVLTTDERAHVLDHTQRADAFIRHLQQRESTLLRVARTIADYQRDFLRHDLLPLAVIAQRELATHLQMHESTISRALKDKVVQLPDRRLWELGDLLGGPRAALPLLRDLIRNRGGAMTDEELAEELGRRGYPVARRTVAKYRGKLGFRPRYITPELAAPVNRPSSERPTSRRGPDG